MSGIPSDLSNLLQQRSELVGKLAQAESATIRKNYKLIRAYKDSLREVNRLIAKPESADPYEQAYVRERAKAREVGAAAATLPARNRQQANKLAKEHFKTAELIKQATPFDVMDRKWAARDEDYAELASKSSPGFRERVFGGQSVRSFSTAPAITGSVNSRWRNTEKRMVADRTHLKRLRTGPAWAVPPGLLDIYSSAGASIVQQYPQYSASQVSQAVANKIVGYTGGAAQLPQAPAPEPAPAPEKAPEEVSEKAPEKPEEKGILDWVVPAVVAGLYVIGGA